ncbi:MAG: hypothetical protein REI64_14595 [Pedobacter sp.]|uniref:hypothetical protein n=1 Tax=Pedobacter sp. TaxID=1411316 RepID=UPI002808666C|nr:hypothetical protein [Pedobacter sp.]MDQ8006028.1 hypothetical protein [Pedobacter sp.]
MKNYTNLSLSLIVLVALAGSANAQQGFGTSNPAPSSVIDMVATNKGALLPRVALTSTTVAAPINAPANSLTVFNTATDGVAPNNVTPGYYYWSVPQAKWIRLIDANTPLGGNNWRVELTTNPATLNTQNIYQSGNVGIDPLGIFATKAPVAPLDVRGAVRGGEVADFGSGPLPVGINSVAFGYMNRAIGENSTSLGSSSRSEAKNAFSVGNSTSALGENSAAFGNSTHARGERSVAFGNSTSADGRMSASFGNATHAIGEESFASGDGSYATGEHSFAAVRSNAVGKNTFTAGTNTYAPSFTETVFGIKNAIRQTGDPLNMVPTDALFQIGNGSVEDEKSQNALTILKNGKTGIGIPGYFFEDPASLITNENSVKPTELLDLGGAATAGNGGLKIRNINSAAYAGNAATDKVVVADATGVLKTITAGALTAPEPWRIQTTTNSATANTDAIYQIGNVAVGDFSGATPSGKRLEVKGNFKAEVISGNALYGTEIDNPLNPNAAMHYWYDGATSNYRAASASPISAALEAVTGTTKNTVSVNNTQAAMASQNGTNSVSTIRNTNTGEFFMESYNVTDNFGSTISLQNNGLRLVHTTTNGSGPGGSFPNNHRTELLVQKTNGIGVDLRDGSGVVKANYFLPITSGTAGQVLTKSSGNSTVWANPVAAPKFFYAPSMVMPTTNTDLPAHVTYDAGTQTFTVDMYAIYSAQFGMTGATGPVAGRTAIKSTGAGNLDVLAANALGYFVTYFDNTVFDPASVSLTPDGKLSYRILATATVTAKTYMNVVFKQL